MGDRIEHLSPDVLEKFAPTLLGIYHPQHLLITTPSYTFNDRFLPPDAPMSARTGFPDPTGRTDRVFRHSDHKFEWTREEFQAWCKDVAQEWGYEVDETSIGRALEEDPWGRDTELQGATQVAAFSRIDDSRTLNNDQRRFKAESFLSPSASAPQQHTLISTSIHSANLHSKKPSSLDAIAQLAKVKMEEFRVSFLRVEDLWFEPDIGELCGGWIEMLVRAIEESDDLDLKRDVDGVRKGRSMWTVELIGGLGSPLVRSGDMDGFEEGHDTDRKNRTSGEYDWIPDDWIPGEASYDYGGEHSDLEETTTGAEEGDVSAPSEDEDETDGDKLRGKWKKWPTFLKEQDIGEKQRLDIGKGWGVTGAVEWGEGGWGETVHVPHSAMSSTGGWDGDESDDETTS